VPEKVENFGNFGVFRIEGGVEVLLVEFFEEWQVLSETRQT